MEDLFKSPLALFARAKEHVEEYRKRSIQTASEIEYEGPIVFIDEVTQENLHAIRITNDIDLLPLGCVAFDAISCLRSVMDQVVFAATCIITQSDNPNDTKFPFAKLEVDAVKQFDKQGRRPGPASGVPTSMHDVLMSFEPFKGGRYALWEFNSVRNTGIHRVIAPSAVAARRPLQFHQGVMGSIKFVNEWDSDSRKAIFLREKGNYFGQFSYQVTGLDVSFGPGTELSGERVLDALNNLVEITLHIIRTVQVEVERILNSSP